MSGTIVAVDGRLANETEPVGVGRYTAAMLEALAAVAPDLRLRIYLDRPPRSTFPLGNDAAEFRVLPEKRFWTHRALGPALRRDRPGVFFSPVTQLPLGCPLPAVVAVHDLAFFDFGEHFTLRQRLVARWQTRYAVGRATRIAALSEATRNDLLARFPIPPDRVSVTLAGVSDAFRPVDPAEARLRLAERYGIEGPYLLYVGRLQPRKNLARLMAAFDRLKTDRPATPHTLVIAGGGGWLMDTIEAARAQARHRAAISFPGRIDPQDLAALYSCADQFLLVSLWEGFGLPVIEAMACGAPVITSDRSSLPEVAGDAALLVNPEDTDAIAHAMATLLDDPEMADELRQKGFERAKTFTWEAAAERLAAILRDAATQ